MKARVADAQPPLRIALLTHSTNPRGGVVHAVEVGDALHALGHDATVLSPDSSGKGLFRPTRCGFAGVPATPCGSGLVNLVQQRIDDYIAWFERPDAPQFDIYHAQDSISANALATLVDRGLIPGFLRTVHHLDQFDDPRLAAWQTRGFMAAERVACVSGLWQENLLRDHGIHAALVGNGVDTDRFTPVEGAGDDAMRGRLGLGAGPVFLAVGGVEPRKNTIAVFEAFVRVRRSRPGAQLLIAGGVSLLDHRDYLDRFNMLVRASGLRVGAGEAIMLLDRIDDEDMPPLFRCADALVFPSLREGFGLAVLEAMACGTPAIVSRVAPFTEYLASDSCAWVDPGDPASIAAGMAYATEPRAAAQLREAGHALCAHFTWARSAALHLDLYRIHRTFSGALHA
jgi:glycosyltransferase-like protein